MRKIFEAPQAQSKMRASRLCWGLALLRSHDTVPSNQACVFEARWRWEEKLGCQLSLRRFKDLLGHLVHFIHSLKRNLSKHSERVFMSIESQGHQPPFHLCISVMSKFGLWELRLVNWSQEGKQGFGSFYYSKGDSFLLDCRRAGVHNPWLLLCVQSVSSSCSIRAGSHRFLGGAVVALLCYLQNQLLEFVHMHLFICFFSHFDWVSWISADEHRRNVSYLVKWVILYSPTTQFCS